MSARRARVAGFLVATFAAASLARAADPAGVDLTLIREGESYLKPTITLEAAIFSEKNAWHDSSREFIGDHVGYWWEYGITGGLEGALALGDSGLVFGRVSALGTGSMGLDAAGSNFSDYYGERLELEDAYVGWRSAKLFPSLGENALELSVGKQKYQIGNGFFMWDGAGDGGKRAAFWLAPRKAFYSSAIARLTTGPYKVEAFYLKPNDEPFTSTDVVGGNFEYTAGDTGTLGVTYLKIIDSTRALRDDLDFLDWRAALTPFASDRNFSLGGEFALEQNGDSMHSYAWYVETGYAFADAAWKPTLSYRHAYFDRESDRTLDEVEIWDPLFYGFNDWSTWYVGEIFGNFVALNRALRMQTLRLRLSPSDAVSVQLIYNYYSLAGSIAEIAARDVNPRLANISKRHIGQGLDLVVDWTATENLSFSGVVASLEPGPAMKQYLDSNDGSWWLHFMLYAKVAF